jgi:hypothetical protein
VSALVVYALAAIAITWPLARHATTHVVLANVAAYGDPWTVGWALAYESRALAGLPHGGIFQPAPYSPFYGETALGALPLFVGPYLATGDPTLGLNTVFLGGLVLTAWSLHAVVRRWTGSTTAAYLAGSTFLACPFCAWSWGPSAINYVTLWYWPWVVYLAARPLRDVRTAVVLGVLVFLQGLSTAYVAVGLVCPLAALAAWRLARPSTRRTGVRLALATIAATLGWAAAFAPYVLMRRGEPGLVDQTLYPFLHALAVPTSFFAAGEPSGVAPVALVLIAAGVVCRLARVPRWTSPWRHALAWTLAGLLLALPPRMSVGGHSIVTPLAWLVDLGVPVHAVRDHARRGIAALIGLCLLVGLAHVEVTAWLARVRGGRSRALEIGVATLVALGILAGLCRVPARRGSTVPTPGRYPLLEVRQARRIDSPLVATLREPGGPLLELPVAPGPLLHADAMHRAAVHGRALVNGLNGYWPRDFPARMALACRLPDAGALAALRTETGLELLLVHLAPETFGKPVGPYACPPRPMRGAPGPDVPDTPWDPAPWEAIARDGRADLALVARDGTDLLFRVRP